jgi:uncharacterized protein (DUF362 family)
MTKYRVSVVKVGDKGLRACVRKSVEILGGMEAFVSPGDRVAIKPNMFLNMPPETGKTTHPAVVLEVAQMAREAGAETVLVVERNFSYQDLFAEFEEIYNLAEAVNLDEAPHKSVMVPGARNLQHPIPVPRLIDEIDVFVNCPGLRMHALSGFSNALKNVMGILPGWNVLHVHGYGLEESYLDLDRYRPSDLVITDAFIAVEGNFPAEGDPRHLDYILAADNPLAADLACCSLLGLDPGSLPVLGEAKARGLGPASTGELAFLGDVIESPAKPVVRPPGDLARFASDFEIVTEGDCYACRGALAGGLSMVRNVARDLYECASGRVRIILGSGVRVKDSPFNLFYGTCANRPRKEMPGRGLGVYIPGCPPLSGFVRRGLALLTARPRAFVSTYDISIRDARDLLSTSVREGVNYVAPTSRDPQKACREIKQLLHGIKDIPNEEWQVIVLSRKGLSEDRGLRFLERLPQEASVAGEARRKDWSGRFLVGLDLPYLRKKKRISNQEEERLILRMAFACGAILLPENTDERLLGVLVGEHYSGILICPGMPSEMEKAYDALYEKLSK